MHRFTVAKKRIATLAATLLATTGAVAGLITADVYGQFSFRDVGSTANGCAPDDAGGDFCVPSGGTPTVFLDTPAWTFVAGAGGATLTVIDAFQSGDRFNVFDFGVLLGATSAPILDVDCGDDPVVCLATAGMSVGSFALGAGNHSLTLVVLEAPSGGGSGYLRVVGDSASAVPEPATLALLAAVVGALALRQRRPS